MGTNRPKTYNIRLHYIPYFAAATLGNCAMFTGATLQVHADTWYVRANFSANQFCFIVF
jgi:hypothetical protein